MNATYPPEKIISIMKGARLFNQFDDAQLIQLLAFSTIEHYEKNSVIIRENKPNQDIYILLKGSLLIRVGDEPILKLRRKGDIIGEMSVITQSVATASVIAATQVVLFKIPSQKIYESNHEELRSQWFQIFSDILTQKLSMTNKQVIGFHEASTQLDEKKKELIQKTLILQSILGSMNDGVVVTDVEGQVIHANPAFVRMTGAQEIPAGTRDWPEKIGLYLPDKKTACTVNDLCVTRNESPSRAVTREFFVTNRHLKSGIWLQATFGQLKADDGQQLEGNVVVFRNYTAKKQEEQALIRAKESAEAAARAKSDFMSVMSHELRTPLNAILGMSDLLKNTALSQEQAEYLESINHSGQTLLTKISNILCYNALESGHTRVEQSRLSLKNIVHQIAQSHRSAVKDKKITIYETICQEAEGLLAGDREKIIQVLDNLVDNAVKYTSQGSVKINVQVAEQNKTSIKFLIKIKDTGIGISPERIPGLLQPFSQADASLSRKFEGTGLGLSIAKKTVELIGGTMKVESVPDKGSCFGFTLPLSRLDDRQEPKFRSQINGTYAKKNPREILVAEDNKVNQLLIKKVLANLGYTIDIAENGRQALEACLDKRYDLVLMDIQMPEMDGLEAANKILLADSPPPPPAIVALTANTAEGVLETCRAAGMVDYLSKPLNLDALVAVLERIPGGGDNETAP